MNCLLLLYNRIWNGDFPNSWNEASIVSIPKKGDLTDCDNYRGISLINNGIKLITKVITNRKFLTMDLNMSSLDPNNLNFVIRKNVLVFIFLLEKFVKDENLIIRKPTLLFWTLKKLTIPFLLVIFFVKFTV